MEGDLKTVPSSVTGEDLWMSPHARDILHNMCWEVKNQEKINIWATHEQAESHCDEGQIPMVAYRRNKSKLYISMEATSFFKLFSKLF